MTDKLKEALHAAGEALGGGLSYPRQHEHREEKVSIPARHLVELAKCAMHAIQMEPIYEAREEERVRLKKLLWEKMPKRNSGDIYLEDYRSVIDGHYDEFPKAVTPDDRSRALNYIAKKYGKTPCAMYKAIQREMKFQRDMGDDVPAILPRNPC